MNENNRGFTLIEAIIYIGLLAIIIVFLVGFLMQALVLNNKISERQDNLENAQYALERMSWYLQNSLEVKEPLLGQSSNELVVNSLVTNQNPVKFFIDNKMLKMQIGTEALLNLTNSRTQIENISFTSQGFVNRSPIIKISLTAANNLGQPLTLETSVNLAQ